MPFIILTKFTLCQVTRDNSSFLFIAKFAVNCEITWNLLQMINMPCLILKYILDDFWLKIADVNLDLKIPHEIIFWQELCLVIIGLRVEWPETCHYFSQYSLLKEIFKYLWPKCFGEVTKKYYTNLRKLMIINTKFLFLNSYISFKYVNELR